MMRTIVYPTAVLFLATAVGGCGNLPRLDEVLPDKRTEYRDARDLPPLEVPPDLTTDTINDSMAIPGEETPATLSAYERQQRLSKSGSVLGGPLENEDQLTLRGDRFSVWPELQRFWQEQGVALDLDDAELGVMETTWSEPREAETGQVRDKFKIFAEPGPAENTTLLFISHDLQRRSGNEWQDAGSSEEVRRQVASALYDFFGGRQPAADTQVAARDGGGQTTAPATPESEVRRAEIINNDQGQVYLLLPGDLESIWGEVESAVVNAGMEIRSADSNKGEFVVAWKPGGEEEEGGWFDALKFWKNDEPAVYRLSLTGLSDRTELVVRDEDGDWQSGDDVRDMLNRIQFQYNR